MNPIAIATCLLLVSPWLLPSTSRAQGAGPPFAEFQIKGESANEGIYDPSLEYESASKGWMSYSSVDAGRYVHANLAKSLDGGRSWSKVAVLGRSVDAVLVTKQGRFIGVWRNEVSTLVHDPLDRGRAWKLFWHKYFTKSPFRSPDRMFAYGWIAYRHAPSPTGPWSQEVALFGAGTFPPPPFKTVFNLNTLHSSLSNTVAYTEPGSAVVAGKLYVSLTAHDVAPQRTKVVLLESADHGKSWRFLGTLLTSQDASQFGALFMTGSSLAVASGRVFLLATPSDPNRPLIGHFGTSVFEFADIKTARLRRHGNGAPVLIKHIPAQRSKGGQSDYDELNVNGGVIMPQYSPKNAPRVFGLFNTGATLGTAPGVNPYGTPSPGCHGSPEGFVWHDVRAGRPAWLACGRAPVQAAGVLLLGPVADPLGTRLGAIRLWIDLLRGPVPLLVQSDLAGTSYRTITAPGNSRGVRAYAQWFWFDAKCARQPLSASAGLGITVQ